ncbi:protein tesmin/tso1-like cxc 2 [Phtheirospermum japonicum]|uniref:Protein tesmin/tso1-like cxc 2 n=1 Tax=Phtheirospermum japonicum TaxID=374723 RepID=A0A830AYF7_9LAMI|nr:protein tesmin/tso1-like cxc 2 [Phtheirospermum japonicum]
MVISVDVPMPSLEPFKYSSITSNLLGLQDELSWSIGQHLNALASTPSDYNNVVNHDSSASRRLLIGPGSFSNFHPPISSGQELLSTTLTDYSLEREIKIVENGIVQVENEETNTSSPKKKRRRLEQAGEGEVTANALLPVYTIESRNPLAFAPKVIRGSGSLSEIGDDFSKSPASALHKRGCNCKKSVCQQLDVVRWNLANQDEIACTSMKSSEVHIYDIGYISSEPVEVLRKRPNITVHGFNVHKGFPDIDFSSDENSSSGRKESTVSQPGPAHKLTWLRDSLLTLLAVDSGVANQPLSTKLAVDNESKSLQNGL